MEVVKKNGFALKFASKELQQNEEIVKEATKQIKTIHEHPLSKLEILKHQC